MSRPDIIIVDGHEYTMQTAGLHGDDPANPGSLVVFRWSCSCRIHGQWQHRRGDTFELWMAHVRRQGPIAEQS